MEKKSKVNEKDRNNINLPNIGGNDVKSPDVIHQGFKEELFTFILLVFGRRKILSHRLS